MTMNNAFGAVAFTATVVLSGLTLACNKAEAIEEIPAGTEVTVVTQDGALVRGKIATVNPEVQLAQAQTLKLIEQALERLPARQREAFLLRYWEELDVAETAAAMGCSEGSVKTHCSRAVHALAETLKAKGITL